MVSTKPCTPASQRRVNEAALDRQCVNTLASFWVHPLKDGDYKNTTISRLAVLGLRDGWMSPLNYTPIYLAVIKVAGTFVVYQMYLKHAEAVARLRAGT